jgi:hypothetical protein
MRAKEDDLIRREPLGDLSRETADDRLRDGRSAKPAVRLKFGWIDTSKAHRVMVSQRFAGNHAMRNFDETNLDGEYNQAETQSPWSS